MTCSPLHLLLPLVLAAGTAFPAAAGVKPKASAESEDTAPVVMASPREGSDRNYYGFIPRVPYQTGRVYRLVLLPGAPFVLELPMGEGVGAAYCDRQWFKADGDGSSNRVMVSALAVEGVESKSSFLQVESTSGILYSFKLDVGSAGQNLAAGLAIYMDGADKEAGFRKAAVQSAGAQATAYQGELERRMRAEYNHWKAETLASYSSAYRVDQDGIKLDKVISNSVQTYLYTRGLSEVPTVKLINRDKQEETLDYEHDNGVYVVNRVLRPGERFVLMAGKSKATVRVD